MSRAAAIAAARVAREEMGLGQHAPLPDTLLRVIEEHHQQPIPVTLLPLPDQVAGAFIRRDGRPFIFINTVHPPARRRFTLAHELGHVRLGHRPVIDTTDMLVTTSSLEGDANAFAAEFLAPEQGVRAWLATKRVDDAPISLEDIVKLAHHFRTSAQSMRIRLQTIGVLRSSTLRRTLDEQIDQGEHLRLGRQFGLSDRAGAGGRDDISQVETGEWRASETAIGDAVSAVSHGVVGLPSAAALLEMDGDLLASRMIDDGVDMSNDEPDPASLDD